MKLVNALYLMINKRNSAKLFWKIKNIYLDLNLKNFPILYVLSNSNSKCWTFFFGFYIWGSWYQIVKLFVSASLNVSRTNKYHILFSSCLYIFKIPCLCFLKKSSIAFILCMKVVIYTLMEEKIQNLMEEKWSVKDHNFIDETPSIVKTTKKQWKKLLPRY